MRDDVGWGKHFARETWVRAGLTFPAAFLLLRLAHCEGDSLLAILGWLILAGSAGLLVLGLVVYRAACRWEREDRDEESR